MESIYFIIVVFLLILSVFDLFVGVSNDAVNFLNSAIGAKVAKFRTVLIVASFGVLVGSIMSVGMMDVARHGIINPSHFSFNECMTIFLAVMITDVIVLDVFNTIGLPTSTTVSLVFELLGGTFILALLKMSADPNLGFNDLLNSEKSLSIIIAIFVSVAIAFFLGVIVQWISRLIFTFNYIKHLKYTVAVFGAVAFTALAYFIFIQGIAKSPYVNVYYKEWIINNAMMLMLGIFLVSSIFVEALHILNVNVFKIIVFVGTFALAMAFAGNDLVNFIGVPLAGLSSFQDFIAKGLGHDKTFMMTSLMQSAKTPAIYLMAAGIIMIFSMAKSKKAKNVVKTSVDLSRQDEGEEMFGSSRAARSLVRAAQDLGESVADVMPKKMQKWIERRFNKDEAIIADGAAFDMIRASVNLVLSSILIIIGTNYKIPLSTTYVTFMVAMGSSLADRAWSRESAVFRVTGVISVIGGWFITAGVAFAICAIVCALMHFGGFTAMFVFMGLDVFLLIRSNIKYGKKNKEEKKDDIFRLMMRTRDPEIVWDLLTKYVSRTQSFVARFALEQYNTILGGLRDEKLRDLRRSSRDLKDERDKLKKFRRKELLALRRTPKKIALERNTWFHLGANSDKQFIYCLTRMLEPVKEHIDNNFTPLPKQYSVEFEPIRREIDTLMKQSEHMISTNRYDQYDQVLAEADNLKSQMSVLRKHHIDRMQNDGDDSKLEVSLVYLNILQESQEFLSIMRHQLRSAKKFMEK